MAALGPRARAPDQAVLVDLADRRFYMFGIEIWPHEFYFVAGLLIMAGIGLFLVTSALGRAWCGYACPQTVWTDLFILSSAGSRATATPASGSGNAPLGAAQGPAAAAKWAIWLVIASPPAAPGSSTSPTRRPCCAISSPARRTRSPTSRSPS